MQTVCHTTSIATEPGAASAVSANEATVAKPSVDASSRAVQASEPAPKAVTETVAEIVDEIANVVFRSDSFCGGDELQSRRAIVLLRDIERAVGISPVRRESAIGILQLDFLHRGIVIIGVGLCPVGTIALTHILLQRLCSQQTVGIGVERTL